MSERGGGAGVEVPVLKVERMTVHADSLELEVTCEPSCSHVPAEAARRFMALLPHLGEQACVSSGHRTFSEEIEGTETAHLLEHLMIELEVIAKQERGDRDPAVFLGSTHPLPKSESVGYGAPPMIVDVTFEDDLVALAACSLASKMIDAVYSRAPRATSLFDPTHIARALAVGTGEPSSGRSESTGT